mmetsp:Transcript_48337/g.114609  ORF Transcript_48337/g.114609 Transcript_48337/m.114609 type:complete len:281 (+) Transcript_48337:158-1000(+)
MSSDPEHSGEFVRDRTNHNLTRSIILRVGRWMGFKSAAGSSAERGVVECAALNADVEAENAALRLALTNRPCINEACTNFAEKAICPRTQQPKVACSKPCFHTWRKQANAVVFLGTRPNEICGPSSSTAPALSTASLALPALPPCAASSYVLPSTCTLHSAPQTCAVSVEPVVSVPPPARTSVPFANPSASAYATPEPSPESLKAWELGLRQKAHDLRLHRSLHDGLLFFLDGDHSVCVSDVDNLLSDTALAITLLPPILPEPEPPPSGSNNGWQELPRL